MIVKQQDAPRGTLGYIGHEANRIWIVKGDDGWRQIDSGRLVADDEFRSGWDVITSPPSPPTVYEHFVSDWTHRSRPFESVCGKVWRPDANAESVGKCPECVEITEGMWSK